MPKRRVNLSNSSEDKRPLRPALTPEAREQQMIMLAMDLVEQRLLNGTASSQETTHFLKLASTKNQLEMEQLKQQTELIKAKQLSLEATQRQEELYKEALAAMKAYSGNGEVVDIFDENNSDD